MALHSRFLLLSCLLTSSIAATCQMSGVVNQPYTATRKTTYQQKLADGTTIDRVTTGIEARDSQGRTLHQQTMTVGPAQNPPTVTTVYDPVAHTMTHWMSQTKQATKTYLPTPSPSQLHQVVPSVSAGSGPGLAAMAGSSQSFVLATVEGGPAPVSPKDPNLRPAFSHEKLGSKNISGVYAEGIRTTVTYPIGYFGNDRPIVTVNETWTSPDLKLTLLSSHEDPRSGTQTTEVINLDRAEPDPVIFQPPPGYQIKEQHPGSN